MNEWPVDANELMVRLHGWWSLNQWLLSDSNGAGGLRNQAPEQVIDYLRTRAEGYKTDAAAWRARALHAERELAQTVDAVHPAGPAARHVTSTRD